MASFRGSLRKDGNKRKKNKRLRGAELERFQELLNTCSDKLPTVVLAYLFDVTDSTVRRYQRLLGKPVSSSEGKRLFFSWCRASKMPEVAELTYPEKVRIGLIWPALKAWGKDWRNHSEQHAKRKLQEMEKHAQELSGMEELSLSSCSRCGRRWPRTQTFFKKMPSCADGLSRQCRLCEYLRDVLHKESQKKGVPKKLRRLPQRCEPKQRKIVREFLRTNSGVIPTRVLAAAFGLSQSTIRLMQKSLGVSLDVNEGNRLLRQWCRSESMPIVHGFTPEEYQRAEAAWRELRRWYKSIWEPGLELEKRARQELRLMSEEVLRHSPQLQQRPCFSCGELWPLDSLFFKQNPTAKSGFTSRCRPCINSSERSRRKQQNIAPRTQAI